MKVYRCCSWIETEQYKKNEFYDGMGLTGEGKNTFNYEKGKSYIHFFYYPENCLYYMKHRPYLVSSIIICDIPDDILKRNFGYGYYGGIYEGRYIPTPEFAIPREEFSQDYIQKMISPKEIMSELNNDKFLEYIEMLPEEYAPNLACIFQDDYDKYSVLNMPNDYVFTKK